MTRGKEILPKSQEDLTLFEATDSLLNEIKRGTFVDSDIAFRPGVIENNSDYDSSAGMWNIDIWSGKGFGFKVVTTRATLEPKQDTSLRLEEIPSPITQVRITTEIREDFGMKWEFMSLEVDTLPGDGNETGRYTYSLSILKSDTMKREENAYTKESEETLTQGKAIAALKELGTLQI